MQLVIVSRNIHKVRELRFMLKENFSIDILSLADFPNYIPPAESGSTFEECAITKAVYAAKALNHWTLADTSGLIVPALGGLPGINSEHFAGKDASDAENRKKLLLDMQDLKDHQRHAYFECWLAIASPQGLKKATRGLCEGFILTEERGNKGFGYDSLFVKHEYGKSFAQIEESLKNRISHRRKALDKLNVVFSALQQPAMV